MVPGSLVDSICQAARDKNPIGSESVDDFERMGIVYNFYRQQICTPSPPPSNNTYHAGEVTLRSSCKSRPLFTTADGLPIPGMHDMHATFLKLK